MNVCGLRLIVEEIARTKALASDQLKGLKKSVLGDTAEVIRAGVARTEERTHQQ